MSTMVTPRGKEISTSRGKFSAELIPVKIHERMNLAGLQHVHDFRRPADGDVHGLGPVSVMHVGMSETATRPRS